MKKTFLIALTAFVGIQASAISDRRNNPQAPIEVVCTSSTGETESTRVMRIHFSSTSGKAYGMNFGPNRGDEGFYELQGECVITTKTQVKE